jgi:hypothetical protein
MSDTENNNLFGHPVEDEPTRLLRKARTRIAKPGGWCQRKFGNPAQSVCAIGALLTVIRTDQEEPHWLESSDYHDAAKKNPQGFNVAIERLSQAIPACWPSSGVAHYNDAFGRTQEDVVALFDFAIKGEKMPSPPKEKEPD